jgi:hypothetical protein
LRHWSFVGFKEWIKANLSLYYRAQPPTQTNISLSERIQHSNASKILLSGWNKLICVKDYLFNIWQKKQ